MIPEKYPNGYSQILSISRFSLPLFVVAHRPPPPSHHPRSSSRFSSLSLSSLAALLLLRTILDLPHASPPSICHRSSKAALEKNQNPEAIVDPEDASSESADTLTSHMNELAISSNTVAATPLTNSTEPSDAGASFQDIDKKIRALKKKIRQAEAQLQKSPVQDNKSEELEKLAKVEGWQQELKLLEGKKAEQASTS